MDTHSRHLGAIFGVWDEVTKRIRIRNVFPIFTVVETPEVVTNLMTESIIDPGTKSPRQSKWQSSLPNMCPSTDIGSNLIHQ